MQVVLHTADQDCFPYYRRMDTLEDTPAMEGNCKIARAGWGKNGATYDSRMQSEIIWLVCEAT